ncbi:tRNA synthetases class II-domain-containing protein [Hypoxylon sp. FL1857]|nr:tRNA synthetases class II-domain-containing protein [Hypoxylon sp. FL1857]
MVRLLSTSIRRAALRCVPSINGRPMLRQCQPGFQLKLTAALHNSASKHAKAQNEDGVSEGTEALWDTYKESFLDIPVATSPTLYEAGSEAVIHGFIGKRKDMSSNLSFCDIDLQHPTVNVQIVSRRREEKSPEYDAHQKLKNIPAYSPVVARGILQESQRNVTNPLLKDAKKWDLKLTHIRCLNRFPKDIIVSKDAMWPPKSRHLQLRFDPLLRDRLRFRDKIQSILEDTLRREHFIQVETPVLFKSTPEGAREFLVPTRRQGYAYALPQSPQQYKQILMAAGVWKYFQFAKCFRDEDHRADRQPEFTQLDLEMAFATGEDVIYLVSNLLVAIFDYLNATLTPTDINGIRHPVPRVSTYPHTLNTEDEPSPESDSQPLGKPSIYPKLDRRLIPSMTYEAAMTSFGSDKPDLRIQAPLVSNITRMEGLPGAFQKMITNLENPCIEGCKFRLGLPPRQAGKFIRSFMDNLPNTTLKLDPESTPGVFIYDSSRPLNGLSSLGHEAAQMVEQIDQKHWPKCEDGDIIIMHARKDQPFYGEGSTDLGRLRTAIYEAAVQQGLLPKDDSFKILWVHSFPLFTPSGDGPGQGGTAGFSSTHHPFTAPKTQEDFDFLKTDPLAAKADHYDLVINGVEIGGGSRRIHVAEVQEYVMRDILKMSDAGVAEFAHLLEALRAGCPPHAGFAFGFDRLLSVLLDVPSVRDVIAFPKNNKGEDMLVGSPAKITPEQQEMYHIFTHPDNESPED